MKIKNQNCLNHKKQEVFYQPAALNDLANLAFTIFEIYEAIGDHWELLCNLHPNS